MLAMLRMGAEDPPQERRAGARRAEDDDARVQVSSWPAASHAMTADPGVGDLATFPASTANSRGGSWLMKLTGLAVRPYAPLQCTPSRSPSCSSGSSTPWPSVSIDVHSGPTSS